MKIDEALIRKALVGGKYVSPQELSLADEYIKEHRGSFLDYLFSEELINKDILGQAIAELIGVEYGDLNSNIPSQENILKIPYEIAQNFRVVLFSEKENSIVVVTDDPFKKGLPVAIAKLFPGTTITVLFSLPEDIDACLAEYKASLGDRLRLKIDESQELNATDIINEVFGDAVALHASDIHFEPSSKNVLIRFRIDGVLRDMGDVLRELYENILNKIKVQSRMRIDEHFSAQDGSMQFHNNDTTFDIRASIVPTVEGEKIVLRVLRSYIEGLALHQLGLGDSLQKTLEGGVKKPFGMIVVTGPTGSGKTTTLYAVLKMLNRSGVNITTIEDPVEYKMKGINQIQVNLTTGLTFARGLRSIVRQDPDVILVGEIRDQETAEIAVNAALTGHLLLSTFHANDAATAIPRMLDMGVEPFLLASTIELIIAQRLVRRVCEQCRASMVISLGDIETKKQGLERFFKEKTITLYEGKGCASCGNSGYFGRVAIFEIISVDSALKDLIVRSPSSQDIWRHARTQGALSLFEDGIEKVKQGVTTIDELLRVADIPEGQ